MSDCDGEGCSLVIATTVTLAASLSFLVGLGAEVADPIILLRIEAMLLLREQIAHRVSLARVHR